MMNVMVNHHTHGASFPRGFNLNQLLQVKFKFKVTIAIGVAQCPTLRVQAQRPVLQPIILRRFREVGLRDL